MGYRIKSVAEMTGVSKGTLLAWERRYGFVVPDRKVNGYREFTEEDVDRIRRIRRLMDSGYKVSEAISLASRAQPSEQRVVSPQSPGLDELRSRLQRSLLSMDSDQVQKVNALVATLPFRTRIHDLYFPILREVGEGWSAGRVTVAQEHHVSEHVREQLLGMLSALGHGPADGPLAMCTTYPGERHELGALGLSVLLALQGHRVVYLGADTPLRDLVRSAQSLGPERVCVAVLLPVPLGDVAAYADALRTSCAPSTRIFIGGAGLPDPMPQMPGVEFVARLSEALL